MTLRKSVRIAAVALIVAGIGFGTTACGDTNAPNIQRDQVEKKAKSQKAYLPTNDVELRAYHD